tara:strand:+ start:3561 stop:3830 length:270 start_codon:yes stop_codon:yes gene_type:complete
MRATIKTEEVPTYEGIQEFIKQISKFKKYQNVQPRFILEWDREDIEGILKEVPRETSKLIKISNLDIDQTMYYTYIYSPLNYMILIKEK